MMKIFRIGLSVGVNLTAPTLYSSISHASRPLLISPLSTVSSKDTTSIFQNPRSIGWKFLLGGVACALVPFSIYRNSATYDQDPGTSESYLHNNPIMQERMKKFGFLEKKVKPDGNCQFRAIADQMWSDEEKYQDIRKTIVSWLKENEKYNVGDSNITNFLDLDTYPSWENYCKYMEKDRSWGDHLTLLAATEALGVELWILSNVEVKNENNDLSRFVTVMTPHLKKPNKTLHLAHYHEIHFTSLHKDPTTTTAAATTTTDTATTTIAKQEPA